MTHLSFDPATARRLRAHVPDLPILTASHPIPPSPAAASLGLALSSWLGRANDASVRTQSHAHEVSAFLTAALLLDDDIGRSLP